MKLRCREPLGAPAMCSGSRGLSAAAGATWVLGTLECLLWPGTGVSRTPTLLPRRTKLGALRAQHQPVRLAPAPAHVSGSPRAPLHSRASLLTQPWLRAPGSRRCCRGL